MVFRRFRGCRNKIVVYGRWDRPYICIRAETLLEIFDAPDDHPWVMGDMSQPFWQRLLNREC